MTLDLPLFRANDPLSVSDAVRRIEECLREIKEWMRDNFMKLNNSKTELILLVGDLVSEKGPSWTISCEK